MNFYKLIIAYDGTDYFGWQRQKKHRTVDAVLRATFFRTFCQKEVLLVGASRTDAGVHARGQVIRLGTPLSLEPEKLLYVLNRALPHDVKIITCEKVTKAFHPQHNVLKKIYSYTIYYSKAHPMESRYGWHAHHPFSLELLQKALDCFVGTHDFKDFCKEQGTGRSTIRTVESVAVTPCHQKVTITVVGPSFLRYMIRRMVGAAYVVASDPEISVNDLINKLTGAQASSKLLSTAPAYGLCLESIEYQNKDTILKGA